MFNILKLLLLYVIIQFVKCVSSSLMNNSTNTTESCFMLNEQTNEHWKLVWEDQFEANQLDSIQWKIEHEESGNHDSKQVSCNLASSVRLTSGFLVLSAKHEPYFEYNYTGAAIVTKQAFRKGRYEIRASLPIGKQIHLCIYTVNERERYWHENGEIDLLCSTNKVSDIDRGVYYANSSDENAYVDESVQLYKNLHEFHLYGVEWDDKELKLFVDQVYSRTIEFNETHGLLPNHQIRFQIGVGSEDYREALVDNFELLHWKCPLLIVDYVKVYEKIGDNGNEHPIQQCSQDNSSTVNDDSKMVIHRLCAKSMKNMRMSTWKPISQMWKIIIIVLFISISVLLFGLFSCIHFIIFFQYCCKNITQTKDYSSELIPKQFSTSNYDHTENYKHENMYHEIPDYGVERAEQTVELDEYTPMNDLNMK